MEDENFKMDDHLSTCLAFEPQKWRKTKCRNCFQDIKSHLGRIVKDCEGNSVVDDVAIFIPCLKTTPGQPDALAKEQKGDERSCSNCDTKLEDTVSAIVNEDLERELKIKNENDGSPVMSRNPSYETGSMLTRYSNLEFSSTSSLASYDALEDATVSSYSYSGSRDNLDGFTSADELSYGETIVDKYYDKGLGDSSENVIVMLEQEIENIRENQKALERNKDRQIQALDRELQNLKIELARYSARENIHLVKNRLEIEGKNLRIEELENETKHLQSTVDGMKINKYTDESQQDMLHEELKRKRNKIQSLEEEERTLEERLKLAEDLQNNDRELLDVLRNQLTNLEKDLLCSEDKNRLLEERVKGLLSVESDFEEEKHTVMKLNKQIDFLSGKLTLREQHVSYLEDDNVKLQQQNKELESKVNKSRTRIDKLINTMKDLKSDIEVYNKEIENLWSENAELKHAHWQAILNQADASDEVQNYITDLEKQGTQSEMKVRDLEFENDSILKESSELLDNLVTSKADSEELRKQLDTVTENYNHVNQMKTDQDKRVITIQRKLKKLQKEKKS